MPCRLTVLPLIVPIVLLGFGPEVGGLSPPAPPAAPVPKHLMPKEPTFAVPTRAGTTWVYDIGGQERTVTIARVEDKDGAKVVTTEWVDAAGGRTPHMVQAVSEKGVFMLAEGGGTYDAPWCVLAYPHRDGRVWEIEMRQNGRVSQAGTMTAGPVERVKVPAGEFTAARVVWKTDASGTGTDWYADGIGLVRTDAGGRPTIALKAFTQGR